MRNWIWTRFWPQLRQTFREWREDDGSLMAAAVSYYAALSLIPLILVLIAGLGFFLQFTESGQTAQEQILEAIAELGSPVLREQVSQAMEQVSAGAAVGGPLGLLTLLFAAITMFAQFETAFDRVWTVEDPENKGILASIKSALYLRGRAFLMLLGVGLLVLCVLIAGIALGWLQKSLQPYLPGGLEFLWSVAQFAVAVVLNALTFAVVYRYLPKAEVRWRSALEGGMLVAVVWELGRQVLAAWLINSRYSSAYGVIGSFLAVMLWIYFASTVVLLGAEYVQVVCRREENPENC